MDAMKPVKVYSCAKRFQADMIIEALKSEGIPAYSQSDGSGEYMEIYMGTSLFGENIYVDEKVTPVTAGLHLPDIIPLLLDLHILAVSDNLHHLIDILHKLADIINLRL